MAEGAIGVSGLAGRYATALFELARDRDEISSTESDLLTLGSALESSGDLRRLINSPAIAREQQARAMDVVAEKMSLNTLTRNFLGLLARNRRLFALEQIVRSFTDLSTHERGETIVEVVSAMPLSDMQLSDIALQLREAAGRKVIVRSRVDGSLLGGLIVKIGSRMIDNSLSNKLERMKLAMKGIG